VLQLPEFLEGTERRDPKSDVALAGGLLYYTIFREIGLTPPATASKNTYYRISGSWLAISLSILIGSLQPLVAQRISLQKAIDILNDQNIPIPALK
jgi:hypothetical protein